MAGNDARGTKKGFAVRTTFGEIFDNGQALEVVAPPSTEIVQLLHWTGADFQIGLEFQVGDAVYQAPRLHSSLLQAIQFPSTAGEYASPEELFDAIASLIRQVTGLDGAAATGAALWIRASWFADLWPSPPLLSITGPERQALRLLRILRALCRHSLMVAKLTRRLPFFLQPTLVIYDPTLTTKDQAWWRATNHNGVFVPDSDGTLRDLSTAKAVYSGENDNFGDSWGPGALRINFLPTFPPVPEWSADEERQLTTLYQPKLLMFRLQNLARVRAATSASRETAGSELARNLLAGMQDSPEVVKTVNPLFDAYEDESSVRRRTDPKAILIEGLWGPSHQLPQIPVADLLTRLNSVLQSRGENKQYTSRETGWQLRQLGIPRRRSSQGMFVEFSSELRRRVHVLARQFGLDLPRKENCPDCAGSQTDLVQENV